MYECTDLGTVAFLQLFWPFKFYLFCEAPARQQSHRSGDNNDTVNIADFPAVQDPVINVFVLLPFFPTLFSHRYRHKSHQNCMEGYA